jgi:hypothetical protein
MYILKLTGLQFETDAEQIHICVHVHYRGELTCTFPFWLSLCRLPALQFNHVTLEHIRASCNELSVNHYTSVGNMYQ